MFDMGPSIEARATLDAYVGSATGLVSSLADHGKVTASTSHGLDVYETTDLAAFTKKLKSLGFHRPGTKIGALARKQLESLSEVDHLLIVSDGERFSWEDFNWRFLAEEMSVFLVPISETLERQPPNIFIDHASYQAGVDPNTVAWDVEIARNVAGDQISGTIKAQHGGKTLSSIPWLMASGRLRTGVVVTWPAASWNQGSDSPLSKEPIVWEIQTSAPNELKADDFFRSTARGMRQDILVISEPRGEMFLDDPSHHLEIALETLGFKIKRLDQIPKDSQTLFQLPLWILLGGDGRPIEDFCPVSFAERRLSNSAEEPASMARKSLPKIWLAPADLRSSYRDICWCFARLTMSKNAREAIPSFCEEVETRDQWVGVLQSLGAKQVGGGLGNFEQSIAWLMRRPDSGIEVLAFTLPLKPAPGLGLSFAAIPLLARSLLTWQDLIDTTGQTKVPEWPRIADLSSVVARDNAESRWQLSNVPIGESLIHPVQLDILPPIWSTGSNPSSREVLAQRDETDSEPWIRMLALVIAAAAAIEVGIRAVLAAVALARKKRSASITVLFVAAIGAWPNDGEGKTLLTLITTARGNNQATTLAREVQSRTSIDLANTVLMQPEIDEIALGNPWLFVASLPMLSTGGNQSLDPRLVSWIKRGGLLVIENSTSEDALMRLTEKGLAVVDSQEGWRVIPPDHELMRSFHLLDSLPACDGQFWRGFHYDGRLAILAVPFGFIETLLDTRQSSPCISAEGHERAVRAFVNLLMVALATDYKKDQIHLPEILKRLR
jgi:hypothetical protein